MCPPVPNGSGATELCLTDVFSISTSSKYYMTVSPVDNSLYVSDSDQRRVLRLTTGDQAGSSVDVVAGSGQTCVRDDQHRCGDDQLAVHAALSHPKGLSTTSVTPSINTQPVFV